MESVSSNNKRIAKNTILLYVRMLFLMLISLYTSRVVLKALGVEDYGIYNVVAGVVVMASFFRNTMSGATQRFLSFKLGKNDDNGLEATFQTVLYMHLLICIVSIVIAESLGLWFLNSELTIPANRYIAANWVYQFSLVTFVLTTLSIPYNAVIISREKMGVFAYFSLIEGIGKLIIAIILSMNMAVDKLILCGFLDMLLSLCVQLLYLFYGKKHFKEAKFNIKCDKTIFKAILGYMGWSLYANFAGVFYGQGLNMLLNIFFGPVVNAARGIAYQIQHAIQNFSINFQTAVNPQIIKYYAAEKLDEMYVLMKRSSRFSFYVMLLLCLPVILTTDIILNIWLYEVPDNAVVFCRLVLIISLIDTVSNPLTTATRATGNLRRNALMGGTNLLLIIPVSYVFLKLGFQAVIVFYVNIFFSLTGLLIRLYINKIQIGFPVKDFLLDVFARGWLIAILAGIIPYICVKNMPHDFVTLIVITLLSVFLTVALVYGFGLTKGEKVFIRTKIVDFIKKIK